MQATPSPPLVFVNSFTGTQPCPLVYIYLSHTTKANSCRGDHVAHRAKYASHLGPLLANSERAATRTFKGCSSRSLTLGGGHMGCHSSTPTLLRVPRTVFTRASLQAALALRTARPLVWNENLLPASTPAGATRLAVLAQTLGHWPFQGVKMARERPRLCLRRVRRCEDAQGQGLQWRRGVRPPDRESGSP